MTKTIKYLRLLGLISVVQASNNTKHNNQKRGYLSTIPKRKQPSQKKRIMTVNDVKLKNAQEAISERKHLIGRVENQNKSLGNMIEYMKHRNAVGDEELKQLNQELDKIQQEDEQQNQELDKMLQEGEQQKKQLDKMLQEDEQQKKQLDKMLQEDEQQKKQLDNSRKKENNLLLQHNSTLQEVGSDREKTDDLLKKVDEFRKINELIITNKQEDKQPKKHDTDNTNEPIVTSKEHNQQKTNDTVNKIGVGIGGTITAIGVGISVWFKKNILATLKRKTLTNQKKDK